MSSQFQPVDDPILKQDVSGIVYWLSTNLSWEPIKTSNPFPLWKHSGIVFEADHEHCAGCWKKFVNDEVSNGEIYGDHNDPTQIVDYVCEECEGILRRIESGVLKATRK